MTKHHHKPKPFFRASVKDTGVLEMMIYEDIGADWFGEGVTAKTVKQQIDDAGVYSSITVRINSPGGDAFEGIAIYNILKSQPRPVNVIVDGMAASAASIIAMAGDTIVMGGNAMMMIHNGRALCMGEASDMRKMADILDKVSSSIRQTYIDKTGKTDDDIKSMMDAETWLSAAECVEGGFATSIAPKNDKRAEAALNMARNFKALKQFANVPENLKPKADDDEYGTSMCECSCENCQDDDDAACTNPDCDDPNCVDCPMQAGSSAAAAVEIVTESNLSQYEARLSLLHLQPK